MPALNQPSPLFFDIPLCILLVVVSMLVGKGVRAAWSRWRTRRER
jgi:hypothetical protein